MEPTSIASQLPAVPASPASASGGTALSHAVPGIVTADICMSLRKGQQELLLLGAGLGRMGRGSWCGGGGDASRDGAEKFSIPLPGLSPRPMVLATDSLPPSPDFSRQRPPLEPYPAVSAVYLGMGLAKLMGFYCLA